MKLSLEPTNRIESVDGRLCRVRIGTSDAGVPVHAWIACVSPQTHYAEANALFERELRELPAPRRDGSIDLRFIA